MEIQKPKRRLIQFRLRTLLILVTLSSFLVGWAISDWDQRRQEQVTIAWIQDMDGHVYFNSYSDDPDSGSWWETKMDKWFGKRVRGAVLVKPVTDLSPLKKLKELERLDLYGFHVADLSPLKKLNNLVSLDLYGIQTTDPSPLAESKNLEWLSLPSTNLVDLSPLIGLKNLKRLNFIHEKLKNDSWPFGNLNNFDRHSIVESHSIDDMPVSHEQVLQLRQALPNCKIHY